MDINLEDIFEIVEEPAHSKNVLLDFQEKYSIDSEELYLFYQQNGISYEELPVTEEEFKAWIHHFIIFKENGGDPWKLKESDIWEENTNYQNKEENYSPCSFLFKVKSLLKDDMAILVLPILTSTIESLSI